MSMVLRSVALALLAGTASLAAQAEEKPPVKIGFVTELTGPWSFFGTSCVAGLKLAEQQINTSGKRRIDFVITDNQTNPAQAVAASRSLDVQDKVLALSGPTSSDTGLAQYGYAEQNKVPFIAPVAAFPQLTKPGTRYTFRLEPNAAGWGYAIAKFVEQRKPGAKIALIYSDYALMRAITAGLKYQAPLSKLNIVADIVFPQGANDATVQAAQVLAAQPDYVFVSGAGGFDNTITNQLLDLGIKPEQIIHPFGITTQVINWGKRSVGSFYGTFFDSNLDALTTEGKTFVEQFTAQNGRPPSYVENFCYVTANVIREVIDKNPDVADDREKFRDAMSALKTKETTSGIPIEFDKNGARKEYIYFMQIQDVGEKSYKAKQTFYTEWDPEVIPVYTLVK
ncbi:ABC transporter substrate-binding protein [Chelatococcus asaccharovorans]|uniref:ABC-type branched-subunit amino acid transport system substrate-binding protein n=1 Tax=Chelatococcus asaccharovorans TaxID=28210 RepID=A0A2V3UDM2_9HYPH|nr:ABC transporter substrate-binding protein [Chelatococcus asaccharovorans]MBS7707160.1 ABC transporter substrate-binding protein [Chelatococcus asaccharovorans]PXW63342.1 ABC-type branched-subunit amino acid transport system substrate-binding protein [Chelatococcus asaccharovorans]CAH1652224.1 ABC-type branched-subunit amino acid transport system substrate-binding protein [Chelatococcus asaccharovorans]CAH1693401.1 ABC-type branched-subunit amino acid transport system substrate-binding protei